MSDREWIEALADSLRGEAEPLRQFGVRMIHIPWWRRRIQKYVMPNRYRLFWQRRMLEQMEAEGG